MLALRLVLSGGPPTMVFDEVDAGIGGRGRGRGRRGTRPARPDHTGPGGDATCPRSPPRPTTSSWCRRRTTARPPRRRSKCSIVTLVWSRSPGCSPGSPGSSTARRHAEELLGAAVRVAEALTVAGIFRRRGGATSQLAGASIEGPAGVDTRTKRLVTRLTPGSVAVIDHEDIDRIAAEALVECRPRDGPQRGGVVVGPLSERGTAADRRSGHPAGRRPGPRR